MKKHLVKVTIPFFGSALTGKFLMDLYCNSVDKVDSKQIGREKMQYTFTFYDEAGAKRFIGSLKKIFRDDYLYTEVSETERFANKWEEFEFRLKNHDWFYEYSDDHRVWAAGNQASGILAGMLNELSELDKPRAEGLWREYQRG